MNLKRFNNLALFITFIDIKLIINVIELCWIGMKCTRMLKNFLILVEHRKQITIILFLWIIQDPIHWSINKIYLDRLLRTPPPSKLKIIHLVNRSSSINHWQWHLRVAIPQLTTWAMCQVEILLRRVQIAQHPWLETVLLLALFLWLMLWQLNIRCRKSVYLCYSRTHKWPYLYSTLITLFIRLPFYHQQWL